MVTGLGEFAGKNNSNILTKLRNKIFLVVTYWVFDNTNVNTSCNQLQALCTHVRYLEKLIPVITIDLDVKEPYHLTGICKCPLELKELDDQYMG